MRTLGSEPLQTRGSTDGLSPRAKGEKSTAVQYGVSHVSLQMSFGRSENLAGRWARGDTVTHFLRALGRRWDRPKTGARAPWVPCAIWGPEADIARTIPALTPLMRGARPGGIVGFQVLLGGDRGAPNAKGQVFWLPFLVLQQDTETSGPSWTQR